MADEKPPKRYYLNVVGDFFVEEDCCTMCGVPQHFAPELFADDGVQCFVTRQPATAGELDRMYEVLASQDIGCVRYAGRNAAILARLRDIDGGRHIVKEPGLLSRFRALLKI